MASCTRQNTGKKFERKENVAQLLSSRRERSLTRQLREGWIAHRSMNLCGSGILRRKMYEVLDRSKRKKEKILNVSHKFEKFIFLEMTSF